MKILNLYSGIGGNRMNWNSEHEITAVEFDEKIAKVYAQTFPNDNVVVGDAHDYLLNNYTKFDFIWASPPCPSHSRARFWGKNSEPIYPDMKLYQEIIFLQNHFDGLWVVENVTPYYKPLIPGKKIGRHLMWSNFQIGFFNERTFDKDNVQSMANDYNIDLVKLKGLDKIKVLRNCVNPEYGQHVLDCAMIKFNRTNVNQIGLFDQGDELTV